MSSEEFVPIAHQDDLWDDEMEAYDVGDDEVLLVKIDGTVHAYDGICPHQSISLVEGELEGKTLTCRAHEWQFDVVSGQSVNPVGECLRRHELRIDDDGEISVRLSSRRPAASTSTG